MEASMNVRRRAGFWALGGLALATLVACSVTTTALTPAKITKTWTDPNATGAELSKIAVVCLTQDPGLRRAAERTVASELTGPLAVPSYLILGETNLRNREEVKVKLRESGADGVLVVRVTNTTERVTGRGAPYGTFDGYYEYSLTRTFAPGYLDDDKHVHVISNLYSFEANKLIWSGVSSAFDQDETKAQIEDVSKSLASSLQKDRLIL
jgi:hypothetical protein